MAKRTAASERRYRLRHDGEDIDVGGRFVVGRESDCQLVLTRDLVSRHHARFSPTPDGLLVEDLRSTNGVFVNEHRIRKPTLLAHGDVVAIGLELLEVVDVRLAPRSPKPTRLQPFERSDTDGAEQVTAAPRLGILSAREREVFELIVLGHTQGEIAEKLHVSVKTVETHRAHVATKLACRTRAELVAYAITAGVLNKPNQGKPR